MKNFLVVFILFSIMVSKTSAQIITNGGFENWILQGSYLNPVGWTTTNGFMVVNPIVVQAPGHTGNYSVGLVTDSTGPGAYVGGQIDLQYTGNVRPLTLSGYWKGTIASVQDEVAATIYVNDSLHNPVGIGSEYIYTTLSNWTPFNLTINYFSGDPAATTDIIITLFTTSPIDNAFLDDFTMSYVTSSNDLITAHFPSAVLLPGQCSDDFMVYVDLLTNASFGLEVYSTTGEKVFAHDEAGYSGHHEINIPAHLFAGGMYVCRINGTGINSSLKFMRK